MGTHGLLIALVVALGINGFSYFYSDKLALRSMRAYPVSQAEQPPLYAIVAELATRARIPMPRLYLSPTQQPNAFATGRNPRHAAVCCTEGILRMMDERELRGRARPRALPRHKPRHPDLVGGRRAWRASSRFWPISPSSPHIFGFGGRNDDEGGANIFELLLLIILGPIAAAVVQLAVSRSREYQADAVRRPAVRRPARARVRASQARGRHRAAAAARHRLSWRRPAR